MSRFQHEQAAVRRTSMMALPGYSSIKKTSLPFPWKLHEMLDNASSLGFESVVSWIPTNNGFKVHNVERFLDTIMPRYFNQTKYKSFQRQLNMWGFERIQLGPQKGGYIHKNLVKGNASLCRLMRRQKIKGNTEKRGLPILAPQAVVSGDLSPPVTQSCAPTTITDTSQSPSTSMATDGEVRAPSLQHQKLSSPGKILSPQNMVSAFSLQPLVQPPMTQGGSAMRSAGEQLFPPSRVPKTGGDSSLDFEGRTFFGLCEWYEKEEQRGTGRFAPLSSGLNQGGRRYSLGLFVPCNDGESIVNCEDLFVLPSV